MRRSVWIALVILLTVRSTTAETYTNFEVSQLHPIALTPSQGRLLVINTPDALLEVYSVGANGSLAHTDSIPVGLEPVSVAARSDSEAWVVNHLSDSISIVDLDIGITTRTLWTGDEPADVVFANGRAFVSITQEDAIYSYDLGNLDAPPTVIDIFSEEPRALAVTGDGTSVLLVAQNSGNQTTVINGLVIDDIRQILDQSLLNATGKNTILCNGTPNPQPPLPPGIQRDPGLNDPQNGIPRTGLIVRWNEATGAWEDDDGQNWNHCLPLRLPDQDLFLIDTTSLTVTNEIEHLGTSLFEVSINPANGNVYVPNTDARNFVRFEHPLGVLGHMVDNQLSIVDLSTESVTLVDLNTHIDRGSDPAANLAERQASISQPGMMVWRGDGSEAFLTAIGSRKVFRVDGSCTTGDCIFGADRANPDVVEVGEGPTGAALLESAERLYVLLRFSNSIAVVDTASLSKIDEIPLHDPSSDTIKIGRRHLYDGIDSSGHGDAACSSCHLFGDLDGLGWDLGNPEGQFVSYDEPFDNVQFYIENANDDDLLPCEPDQPSQDACAGHNGYDPQKGPMTTQTLRGMLEPLHWRGDRPTMNNFNMAFVGLMGTEDIGPINGQPAGLSQAAMEEFRQFALGMSFPPNPFRNVDDTLADELVFYPEYDFTGNPAAGAFEFRNTPLRGPALCTLCHQPPFGTIGGKLGGVEPQEPTSPDVSGLFNGKRAHFTSNHSDIVVAHMRNLYEKQGPLFGDHVSPDPDSKAGFGLLHDGSIPDLITFLCTKKMGFDDVNLQQLYNVAAFLLNYSTSTKPAIGQSLTVPPGTPPTGSQEEEDLLQTLIGLGDLSDPNRHCELTAATLNGGRLRRYHLDGGSWTTDVATEAQVSTTSLRENAGGPISFLCATIEAGSRLGGDRDFDGALDGDDCSPGDPTDSPPALVSGVRFASAQTLEWDAANDPAAASVLYDVATGGLSVLRSSGIGSETCLAGDLSATSFEDLRADPLPGDGYHYLLRAQNACGSGSFGAGRSTIDGLVCP